MAGSGLAAEVTEIGQRPAGPSLEAVDQQFKVEAQAAPERLFPIVADLGRYAELLDIVHRVEPDAPGPDGRPAWLVTLRAKLGPFARSKRLRMVRTVCDEPHRVRFERAELDGRDHSSWVLEALVEPSGTGSTLIGETTGSAVTMALAYGGSLWTSALEGLLRDQVTDAVARLDALAAA